MGNIVLLDEITINKIAAGEVIERPASVIKEMMENSIDAGARNITVEIKNGGISFIRITDNGRGIARDDIEMAFERHATSKIRSAEDLNEVKSMGFRGEALASIASIANVELVSRTKGEDVGTRIVVEGGKVLSIDEIGCSKGTTITVRNLFFNTPVRYKFLKKDFTESGYIEDVIARISLIYPEVSIKFINTGKTIMQTNGNGNVQNVIYNIYGKEVANNLVTVNYEYEYIKIKGVVGKEEIARSNRSNQIFFVNKRYIKDKTLTSAVEQAFKGVIPFGKYPFLVLNIKMPQSKVDVNVHPAKLEVRFEEESVVFKAMYHAMKDAIQNVQNKTDDISITQENIKKIDNLYITQSDNKNAKKSENIVKNEKDINEINNSVVINNMNPEEFNVIKRLKMIQENLKMEVEKNPNLKLTDQYKNLEQKYSKSLKEPIETFENISYEKENIKQQEEKNIDMVTEKKYEEDNIELPKALRKSSENIVPILFQDSQIEKVEDNNKKIRDFEEKQVDENKNFNNEEQEIANDQKNEEETRIVENEKNEEEKNKLVQNEEKEDLSNKEQIKPKENEIEISEEKIEIKKKNEKKNNINNETSKKEKDIIEEEKRLQIEDKEKKIETIQNNYEEKEESGFSFNEMYRKIFGKEPYGGRNIEDSQNVKRKKEEGYENLSSSTEDNFSLFENSSIDSKIQYKIIGVTFDTYIVLEIENELYIMDAKLARERIIYEELKNIFYDSEEKASQLLLLPDLIDLNQKQMNIAKDNLALFRKAGFIVEDFGENTIKLIGVPEICIDMNTKELFEETLDEINTVARNAIKEKEEKFLDTIAHKTAYKQNIQIERGEIEELIDKLLELPNPFMSSQEKPIVIKISRYQIERKFARK